MTERFQRYAIYWTPEPGSALADFGARWFGAGAETFGLPPELAGRAARNPAKYSLHATLKAPFRLREGTSERELREELDAFCTVRRGPVGGAFELARFQGYLGLVLSSGAADLDWLAAECVTRFDRYRAPLNGSDREKRDLPAFSPEERAFFETFGYPYVLSAFRFHVSLAGPLEDAELDDVAAALRPHLAPFMTGPVRIESVSLLGEPHGGGVFEFVSRHRFRWNAAA